MTLHSYYQPFFTVLISFGGRTVANLRRWPNIIWIWLCNPCQLMYTYFIAFKDLRLPKAKIFCMQINFRSAFLYWHWFAFSKSLAYQPKLENNIYSPSYSFPFCGKVVDARFRADTITQRVKLRCLNDEFTCRVMSETLNTLNRRWKQIENINRIYLKPCFPDVETTSRLRC